MNNREIARTTCSANMDAFGKAKGNKTSPMPPPDSDGRKKARAKARAKFGRIDHPQWQHRQEVAKKQSGVQILGPPPAVACSRCPTGDLRGMEPHRRRRHRDLKRPEIWTAFRMPHGNNDTELAGTARAFIKSLPTSGCTTPLSSRPGG